MLVGQDNILHIPNRQMLVGHIYQRLGNIIIDSCQDTEILAVRHHKKYKVLFLMEFTNNDGDRRTITVSRYTLFLTRGLYLTAEELMHGNCISAPSIIDHSWTLIKKQIVLGMATTFIPKTADFMLLGDIPLIIDNKEYWNIYPLVRKNTRLGNLALKLFIKPKS